MDIASPPLLETLTRLDAALGDAVGGALGDDSPRTMTDADAIALARIAESLGRRVDALRIVAAGEIDHRSRPELGAERLSGRHGCVNAIDLLTRLTGVASGTAHTRVQTARLIATRTTLTGQPRPAHFPAIREAVIDGTMGLDGAAAISRVLGPIADRCAPGHLAVAESELVEAATGAGAADAPACTADETRLQAKVWRLFLDPDGTLPEQEKALRDRSFILGRERNGIVPFRGGMLPDVAAQVQRLFDCFSNPRTHDRTDDPGVAFREVPDEPEPLADTRTRAQRQHDVLAAILGVAARAAETPSIGGAPPTLLVTISADELQRADGVGFVDGTDCAVPASVARQIACCGGIQRLVLDENGRIIDLGSPQRVFTSQQRRAIHARDGGCVIPGCHVAAEWCEIHHVAEHARGGPTHIDNGVPLCWWHHRSLDWSGWEIRMVDGMPQVRAPASIDPARRWRATAGSMRRQYEQVGRRLAGPRSRGRPARIPQRT